MLGIVRELYIAQGAKGKMWQCDTVTALEGIGLNGDRYALGTGSYSQTKVSKVRHVSIVTVECIQAVNETLEVPFLPSETRRNIVIEGLDIKQLFDQRYFTIGDVVMLATKECDPCAIPGKLANKPNFEKFVGMLGGIRAQILTSGPIHVGSEVKKYRLGTRFGR